MRLRMTRRNEERAPDEAPLVYIGMSLNIGIIGELEEED